MRRSHRALALGVAAGALTAGGVAAGAVNPPHLVTVGMSENSVSALGYTPSDGLVTVEARRGAVLMARATARATPSNELSVNAGGGAGDVCWDSEGVTPDLSPGDTIRLITSPAPPALKTTEETAPLPTLTVGDPVEQASNTFRIEGLARAANGIPLPLNQLLHDLSASVPLNGAPSLTAPGDATLLAPVPGQYRIDYVVTSPTPAAATIAGAGSLLTWTSPLGTEVVTRFPGADAHVEGCSAPFASDAVTEVSPAVIGAGNQGQTTIIKGFSQHGTDVVHVTVDDTDHPETPPIAVQAVPFVPPSTVEAGGIWSVSIPNLSSLADGRLLVSVTSEVGGTPIAGFASTMLKDLVAPAAPLPSIGAGLVAAQTAITLSSTDNVGPVTVRYTLDGSQPDASSTVAAGPITIGAGGARIRAVAFDAAGNRSAETALEYVVLDGSRNAVVASSPPSLTAEAVRSPVTISGIAQVDATAVAVNLTSGGVTIGPIPATLGPVAGASRGWSAVIPPVQLQRLPDGVIQASARITMGALVYTTGVAPLTGGVLVIPKDTLGPKAVLKASVPPGTFLAGTVPRVRIAGCPRGATLRYTTDGSVPTLGSASAMPVAIRDTFVRLRAACLDSLGNPGGTRSFAYRAIVGRLPSAPLVTPSSKRIPLGRARLAGLRVEVPVNFVEPTRIRLVGAGGRLLVDRLGAIVPGAKKARLVLSAAEVRKYLRPGFVRIVIGPFGKTIEVAKLAASRG